MKPTHLTKLFNALNNAAMYRNVAVFKYHQRKYTDAMMYQFHAYMDQDEADRLSGQMTRKEDNVYAHIQWWQR